MTTLLAEFAAVTNALNEAEIDYAVCGGWAMTIHGFVRATIDIDLMILTEDLDRVWMLAKSLGYDVEGLPLSFNDGAVEIRRISKLEDQNANLITLDLLLVTDALTEIWQGRQQLAWELGIIPTVSREGLIQLKTMAGRPQDLVDIERLSEERDDG